MKPKTTKNKLKLPNNAMAFYIKLYWARKGSTKTKYDNKLIEAVESWVSLSETEKQQFHIKFKEREKNYKLQFFDQLKNAEVFMKEKNTSLKKIDTAVINLENTVSEDNSVDTVPVTEPKHPEPTEEIDTCEQLTPDNDETNPSVSPPIELPEHMEEENENITEAVDSGDQPKQTILMEPFPPTVKSALELFYMLNPADEDNNWTSLPRLEKNRYSRAVSIMKKDYITKYKEYLESLSDKELFDHYNKTIL